MNSCYKEREEARAVNFAWRLNNVIIIFFHKSFSVFCITMKFHEFATSRLILDLDELQQRALGVNSEIIFYQLQLHSQLLCA